MIDWRNTSEGLADLDTALSALIMAQVALGDMPDLAAISRALLPTFLSEVDGQPLHQLDHALAIRGTDANLTPQEVEDLTRAATLVRESLTHTIHFCREPRGHAEVRVPEGFGSCWARAVAWIGCGWSG